MKTEWPLAAEGFMEPSCSQCFLEMIEESGECFHRWQPEVADVHPQVEKIIKKPAGKRTRRENLMVHLENERLREGIQVLKDFQQWREKMGAMMTQALEIAEAGGIFYHPCSGCPKWEERRSQGEEMGARCGR